MSDANGGWLPAGDKYELSLDGGRVIATANLRDRGVSEMSAALKRRFNFELVEPIADEQQEQTLIERQATAALARVGAHFDVDRASARGACNHLPRLATGTFGRRLDRRTAGHRHEHRPGARTGGRSRRAAGQAWTALREYERHAPMRLERLRWA